MESRFSPLHTYAKVGIVDISLKHNAASQAIDHSIDYTIHFHKQTAIQTYMAHHPSIKGFAEPPI